MVGSRLTGGETRQIQTRLSSVSPYVKERGLGCLECAPLHVSVKVATRASGARAGTLDAFARRWSMLHPALENSDEEGLHGPSPGKPLQTIPARILSV